MNTNAGKKSLVGLAVPLFALSANTLSFGGLKAECQSNAEKEAEELEKILQSQNGGMPVDPEEMQELLAEARNKGKQQAPPFMQFMMPLKSLTSSMPNDGFHFGFGVPITPKFQCQMQWLFSNKKPSQFELTSVLLLGGNPMNQEDMSMVQVQAVSPQQPG